MKGTLIFRPVFLFAMRMNLLYNQIIFSAHDGMLRRDSKSVIFTPIFHLTGFFAVLIMLYMGNTSVTMERFDMEEYLMLIEQYKVRKFAGIAIHHAFPLKSTF